MEITLIILALLLLCSLLAIVKLAAAATKNRQDSLLARQEADTLSQQLSDSRQNTAQLQQNIDSLQQNLTSLKSEYARIEERAGAAELALKQERAETENRFKAIAGQILKETSREMKSESEQRIGELLSPLTKNIDEFKRTMDANFRSEAEGRASLKAHIESLRELNSSIGKEARELTVALRGNSKIQGDWGEMILTSLLKKSGLQEGLHYTVQQTKDEDRTLRGADGEMLRPDVVMNYPDGKKVIIDSKVSLTAFTEMVNAENEADRQQHLARHIRSVKKHIDELSSKDYPSAFKNDITADFSLMFIPHEPAYISAMEADNSLWEYAYSRRVVIVSPTHLLSVLRLLSQIWQQDKINRNTIKIAEESGKMLDMLFAFKDEMESLGKAIANAQTAHDNALRRLYTGNGNIARRASTLLELGAKAKKSLPKSWESEE